MLINCGVVCLVLLCHVWRWYQLGGLGGALLDGLFVEYGGQFIVVCGSFNLDAKVCLI